MGINFQKLKFCLLKKKYVGIKLYFVGRGNFQLVGIVQLAPPLLEEVVPVQLIDQLTHG